MDPNACLTEIRDLTAALTAHRDAGFSDPARIPPAELSYVAGQLAEAVGNLDEWLTRGGFYPQDWQPRSQWETRVRTDHVTEH